MDLGAVTHRTAERGVSRAAAAVLVLFVLLSCSRRDADVLNHPQVVSWQRFFFIPDAEAEEDGTMEFSCVPIPNAVPEESAGGIVCSDSGGVCLVVDTGYLKEKGRVMRGEPDSSVSLYYPDENRMCRFLTIGTAGGIHGGLWVAPRVFAVYGLEEGSGFLWKVSLDEGDVRKYKIPADRLKPGADEQAYFAGMKTACAGGG